MFVVVLTAIVLINLPFLSSYAVQGDDFALILHSSRFFPMSPIQWVTQGYRDYNVNFPEIGPSQTNFIRPTINASVYLISWLSPRPTSVVMLGTNYVGHALMAALVFLVSRRIFSLSLPGGLLASALFAGSVSSAELLHLVAFGGDMIAAVFAILALLVTASRSGGRPNMAGLAAISGLLGLSMFAKETALAAPGVVGVYFLRSSAFARGPHAESAAIPPPTGRPWPVLVALGVPLLAYLIVRAHAGLGGNYVLSDLGETRVGSIPLVALNSVRFFLTAFFPIETDTLQRILSGGPPDAASAIAIGRGIAAMGVNVLIWIMVGRAWRLPHEGRWLGPALVMTCAAAAVPIVVKADNRFMYFEQALLLPVLVALLGRLDTPRPQRHLSGGVLSVGFVVLLIAIGPGYFLTRHLLEQPALVRDNRTAASLEAAITDQLRDPGVKRLYLLNAPLTLRPGIPALEFLAALDRRTDVKLRVVDTLDGAPGKPDSTVPGVRLTPQGTRLKVTIRIGPGQQLFSGIDPRQLRRLGDPDLLTYEPITAVATTVWGRSMVVQTHLVAYIPDAVRGDYVLVGLDPSEPGVHVSKPPQLTWQVPHDGS